MLTLDEKKEIAQIFLDWSAGSVDERATNSFEKVAQSRGFSLEEIKEWRTEGTRRLLDSLTRLS